jgi:hypothetical protein
MGRLRVLSPFSWAAIILGSVWLLGLVSLRAPTATAHTAGEHRAVRLGSQCPGRLPLPSWIAGVPPASRVAISIPGAQGYLDDLRQAVVWDTGAWRYQAIASNTDALTVQFPFFSIVGTKLTGRGVLQLTPHGSTWQAQAAWTFQGRCHSLSVMTGLSTLPMVTAIIRASLRVPSARHFRVSCVAPADRVVCRARPVP